MNAAEALTDALSNKHAWLVTSTWERLHYIPGETIQTWETWWDDDDQVRTAACGRTMEVTLPGWFSRMGGRRCKSCCKALGITPGDGAPVNDKTCKALT